jgi:hypothetical protein
MMDAEKYFACLEFVSLHPQVGMVKSNGHNAHKVTSHLNDGNDVRMRREMAAIKLEMSINISMTGEFKSGPGK